VGVYRYLVTLSIRLRLRVDLRPFVNQSHAIYMKSIGLSLSPQATVIVNDSYKMSSFLLQAVSLASVFKIIKVSQVHVGSITLQYSIQYCIIVILYSDLYKANYFVGCFSYIFF
jgi:hypothetical protein